MKIIHLCTTDVRGGAHRAAYRLHHSLLAAGVDSSIWVAEKRTDDSTVHSIKPNLFEYLNSRIRWRHLPLKFFRYWKSRPKGFTVFSDHRSRRGKSLMENLPDCDLIHLHWVSGFVDFPEFFQGLPPKTKLVWTLHDMNAFTGGCHYALDCKAFTNACGACPQLGSKNPTDRSNWIFENKHAVFKQFSNYGLQIVTPSRWMADQVRSSKILKSYPVKTIPNGLDLTVFSPRDQKQARENLKLPQDKKIVLFVANAVNIRHKGYRELIHAFDHMGNMDDILLVSLGSGKPDHHMQFSHLHLGHFSDNAKIAEVYSAADLFVIPSLQDNLPNTVLETLACGTPVVGFEVGGIPDMVRPGVTGLLVPAHDVIALGDTIQTLLKDEALRKQMSQNCSRIALEEYSLELQAQRYLALYQNSLKFPVEVRQ